jgi:hypothetical protein
LKRLQKKYAKTGVYIFFFKVLDDKVIELINSVTHMTKNFLTIFILAVITFGVFTEAESQHYSYDSDHIESVSEQVDSNMSLNSSEDDCEDNHCNDKEGHCAHHCSGIHNAALDSTIVKISTSIRKSSKLLWYYFNKYQNLDIDPALRPPTHS